MAKRQSNKPKGPKPERLKIKGDWETAIGKALKKERPKQGWPVDQVAKPRRAE